jgi:phenol 2-monooxygenase
VLDYFAEFMKNSPTRMEPDYGYEFAGLEMTGNGEYPVTVTLVHTSGEHQGRERTVRAKYVVGADGARSKVRQAIGCTLAGDQAGTPGGSWTPCGHGFPGHPPEMRHPVR